MLFDHLAAVGSSPRVRGIRLAYPKKSACGGSSPRVRGILEGRVPGPASLPVHPRGCGEYHFSAPTLRAGHRFIPAGAGNTRQGTPETEPCPLVHPRGCGEYGRSRNRLNFSERFIPAGAGNTPLAGRPDGYQLSVHPRGCGEYEGPRELGIRGILVHPRGCGEYQRAFTPGDL